MKPSCDLFHVVWWQLTLNAFFCIAIYEGLGWCERMLRKKGILK